MRIALVDDDRGQLQLLHGMLTDALAEHGIHNGDIQCFSDSRSFLAAWQSGGYDIVIFDIYIDETSGVELAQAVRRTDQNAALVFCTSSNEFAAQSYEVNARYYLQKPVTAEKLSLMLRRINLSQIEQRRSIRLPDGYRLLLRRLAYTSYNNHVVTFYIQGMEPHATYISQAEVEQMLSDACFYAANKGSIVNFHMVRKVTPDGFRMKDDSLIPIARRRYKEAEEAYTSFHFRTLCEEAES